MSNTVLKPLSRRVVLLSGMSGAGLSSALKVFEDLGYECVDNLRLSLVPALVEDATTSGRHLAVAIDTRNATFSVQELLRVDHLLAEKPGLEVSILFLDCSDDILQQRFTETRRRHPMALDRPLTDGIHAEREVLWGLKNEADRVIDTSHISVHDLRRLLIGHYQFDDAGGLNLFITSFSYRHGIPRESDLVFDVRFLVNPHWEQSLRHLSGCDKAVADYIRRDPDYEAYIGNLTRLIVPLLPRYQHEGKSYLTIAVGCTGGRHRSVMIAEELANVFAANGYVVGVGHRDLDRSANRP